MPTSVIHSPPQQPDPRPFRAAAAPSCEVRQVFRNNLDALMYAARQAPSPGARRPWLFRSQGQGVELRAAAHPGGRHEVAGHAVDRQDLIACGAALFNMRLAAAHFGLDLDVRLLPDPGDPALLVRLTATGPRQPRADEEELLSAVSRRHTRRDPFIRTYVPPALLDHIAAAAAAEGAGLVVVPPGDRLALLDVELTSAQERLRDDPAAAAGLRAIWPRRRGGAVPETGQLEVLTTVEDTPADWLRAGQALQRLLLTATTQWVAARFFTLALEDPAARERLRVGVCDGAYPQVVLELGDVSTPE